MSINTNVFLPALTYVTNPQFKQPLLHLLETLFADKMEDLALEKGDEKCTLKITLNKPCEMKFQNTPVIFPKTIHIDINDQSIDFPIRDQAPYETDRGYIWNNYYYWRRVILFRPGEYTFLYHQVHRVFLVFSEVSVSMKFVPVKEAIFS